MILEAFSEYLHRERADSRQSARDILARWLLHILTEPAPTDNVSKIIHTELALANLTGQVTFKANSPSGQILLNTLFWYCDSYEHWQFTRWLHEVKPGAFNRDLKPE